MTAVACCWDVWLCALPLHCRGSHEWDFQCNVLVLSQAAGIVMRLIGSIFQRKKKWPKKGGEASKTVTANAASFFKLQWMGLFALGGKDSQGTC